MKQLTLDSLIAENFRIVQAQARALKRLNIETVQDLLFHFPSRYQDLSNVKTIISLEKAEDATVYGKVSGLKTKKAFRKKIPMSEATITDATGKIKATWFHQAYISKMFTEGTPVKVSGKVSERNGALYFTNPEIEKLTAIPDDTGGSLFGDGEYELYYPVYPESKGITSKWFYHTIKKVLGTDVLSEFTDPIPAEILKKYNLPTLKSALVWIHTPKKEADARAARKRFAFQEIFFIQLARLMSRNEYEKYSAYDITNTENCIEKFLAQFPFDPTGAQTRAIDQIVEDFASGKPMVRLVEGDVGSGKTLVAASTAYAVANAHPPEGTLGNLQVAYMAPTEILARQHYQSFIEYFSEPARKGLPIQIGLLTGTECRKFPSKVSPDEDTHVSRAQLLKWIASGDIPILVGTHALIQKSVQFKNLAYAIIDEQHRFGVMQRMNLTKKNIAEDAPAPHLLSMTATPIPRTLALTIYGDLDLTLVDEMPKGRKQIITDVVQPEKRAGVYEKVREELKSGRQVYVICPRIDEPDPEKLQALNVKSVKAEAKRLKEKIFPEFEIDLVHSKLKPKDKDDVMDRFTSGEIDVLVSTSVVEVGVNVPNATTIIIEGAERFGLSQLHQLRGRVLRSNHQAYCYVFADTKNKTSLSRLSALVKAKNGFELSELDLELRGAGELSGSKQWGISDIGMEAIKNIKMVEAARNEAQKILKKDSALASYPLIKEVVTTRSKDIHFE